MPLFKIWVSEDCENGPRQITVAILDKIDLNISLQNIKCFIAFHLFFQAQYIFFHLVLV